MNEQSPNQSRLRPAAAETRAAAGERRAQRTSRHPLLVLQTAVGNRAVTSLLESPVGVSPTPPTRESLALLGDIGDASSQDKPAVAAAGLSSDPELFAMSGRSAGADDGVIPVHDSAQSHRAAATLHVHAYTFSGEIGLGAGLDETDGPGRSRVLAHELAHARQMRNGSPHSSSDDAEAAVLHGREGVSVDPGIPQGLFWLIPVAVGAYILLRPNVANAPTPRDAERGNLQPSVSGLQVAAEAVALFAVPGGVASGLARAGYGVIAASAVGGASSSMAFRGVQDVGAGEFSGPEAYVVDAGTGAVIGAVVGGAVRIFGSPKALGSPATNPDLVHFTLGCCGDFGQRIDGFLYAAVADWV